MSATRVFLSARTDAGEESTVTTMAEKARLAARLGDSSLASARSSQLSATDAESDDLGIAGLHVSDASEEDFVLDHTVAEGDENGLLDDGAEVPRSSNDGAQEGAPVPPPVTTPPPSAKLVPLIASANARATTARAATPIALAGRGSPVPPYSPASPEAVVQDVKPVLPQPEKRRAIPVSVTAKRGVLVRIQDGDEDYCPSSDAEDDEDAEEEPHSGDGDTYNLLPFLQLPVFAPTQQPRDATAACFDKMSAPNANLAIDTLQRLKTQHKIARATDNALLRKHFEDQIARLKSKCNIQRSFTPWSLCTFARKHSKLEADHLIKLIDRAFGRSKAEFVDGKGSINTCLKHLAEAKTQFDRLSRQHRDLAAVIPGSFPENEPTTFALASETECMQLITSSTIGDFSRACSFFQGDSPAVPMQTIIETKMKLWDLLRTIATETEKLKREVTHFCDAVAAYFLQ